MIVKRLFCALCGAPLGPDTIFQWTRTDAGPGCGPDGPLHSCADGRIGWAVFKTMDTDRPSPGFPPRFSLPPSIRAIFDEVERRGLGTYEKLVVPGESLKDTATRLRRLLGNSFGNPMFWAVPEDRPEKASAVEIEVEIEPEAGEKAEPETKRSIALRRALRRELVRLKQEQGATT